MTQHTLTIDKTPNSTLTTSSHYKASFQTCYRTTWFSFQHISLKFGIYKHSNNENKTPGKFYEVVTLPMNCWNVYGAERVAVMEVIFSSMLTSFCVYNCFVVGKVRHQRTRASWNLKPRPHLRTKIKSLSTITNQGEGCRAQWIEAADSFRSHMVEGECQLLSFVLWPLHTPIT